MIGFALRQGLARDLLAHPVLQRQGFRLAVPHIDDAGFGIAVGIDDPDVLIVRARAEIHFEPRQFRLQPAVVSLEGTILEVAPVRVVFVFGEKNAVIDARDLDVEQIDALVRIAFDLGRGAGGHIQHFQLGQVQRALVGGEVDILAAGIEIEWAAILEHAAAVQRLEAVGIDPQGFGVAALGGSHRQAQRPGIIELPDRNLVGIFAQQFFLARGDAQFVQVMPLRVAVIQSDIQNVRLGLGHGKNLRSNPFEIRQRAGRRHAALRIRGQLRVDRIDVEVLIAAGVLHVQDVLRIVAPKITADRPARFRAHRARRAERLIRAFHPNIAGSLVGLQE